MQLSTRGRYAVMAMVHLAGREQESCARPVTLAEIAAAQQLSLAYLEQLFVRLRRACLVVSARGPGGGYRLARPADSVSVAEIIDAVEENLRVTRCAERGAPCQKQQSAPRVCATHALWHELGLQIQLFLGGVSLADVLRGHVAGRASPPR